MAEPRFISLTQSRGAVELYILKCGNRFDALQTGPSYGEMIAMTLKKEPDLGSPALPWDDTFDTIVLGSGLAGLTAAMVSTIEGKKTLLLEKSAQIGGTSALSSGSTWIPNNSYQRKMGITNDRDVALTYLDALIGNRADRALREAFLDAGPGMLAYLEEHIDLRWLMFDVQPDYEQSLPGATTGGRALMPLPFDGRRLGKDFDLVRWPIPELMLFGGMMITRAEASRLLKLGRNLDSILLGAQLCGRFILDRLRYRRGTRLVLGNALVAKLLYHLIDHEAAVWVNSRTAQLILENGRVCGAVVQCGGVEIRLRARLGHRGLPRVRPRPGTASCWQAEASRQARNSASVISPNRQHNTRQHATAAPAIPCGWHRISARRSDLRVRTTPSGFRVPSPNAGTDPRRFSRISSWIERSPD